MDQVWRLGALERVCHSTRDKGMSAERFAVGASVQSAREST